MATAVPALTQDATYAYVGALVDELARSGVSHACICPGSRSTPLALCLVAHPTIRPWVHVDERSAAFFALGLAKASRSPVALVCTSGTAAANFLPAVVEARYGRVPLLVLTADRPPELRENGAPQAIDQIHLYGGNVKWFVELALPEANAAALRYIRTTAARAVATARESLPGPVHLNLPFREPLVPATLDNLVVPPRSRLEAGGPRGQLDAPASDDDPARPGARPYAAVAAGRRTAPPEAIARLAQECIATPRGIIVCGPQSDPDLAAAVVRLAAATGYPILADPLSGLRSGGHERQMVIDAYDAFLRDERAAALAPDVVLRLGAPPTSKTLMTFLHHADRHILIDEGWPDPSALASAVVQADATHTCTALAHELAAQGALPDPAWSQQWLEINCRTRAALVGHLAEIGEPFEGKVFAELAALLPDGATLYVGNSMPVRDLDTFYPTSNRRVRMLGNRGANGIDGVVSSALGAAAATDGPLVLAIGDLSFYHDMNGLLAARRYGLDATIVLLNNDGGGIFSFLPQAAFSEHFEELFGTPTGLDFAQAAALYGCGFARPDTWAAFRRAVAESLASPGVQVIEVRTERARNVALHREVWAAVAEAVWRA